MAIVSCMRHRHYKGEVAPDLTCSACCKIFIEHIRGDKKRQASKAAPAAKTPAQMGKDPLVQFEISGAPTGSAKEL